MSARLARPLAVALLTLTTLLAASGWVLSLAFPDAEVSNRLGLPLGFLLPEACAVIGCLIVIRQTHNTMGWLLLGIGADIAATFLTEVYEPIVVANPGAPVGLEMRRVISNLTYGAMIALICLILQLFPTGRPLSPRWRYLAWVTGIWLLIGIGGLLLRVSQDPIVNSLLIAWLPVLLVMSVVSILVRTSRASGAERQQIKWLAFGAIPGVILVPVAASLFPQAFPLQMVFFMWLPLTVGVAVLRHRLYDIDRLVNRTAVYFAVSVLLAAVYGASVLLLTVPLSQVSGGDALAVAGSTLAAAALFQPVRAAVQRFVDHRFDRARFDGALTIAAFGTRLRDEVDLDSVLVDLHEVIRATIGPSSASVWLSPTRGGVAR